MKKPLCRAILTVALTIVLALCLLPATALGAPLSRLFIGNIDLEIRLPDVSYYTYGTNTAITGLNMRPLPDSGWEWAVFNAGGAYTLILNNATLECTYNNPAAGIHAIGDLTLDLLGTSTVKGPDTTAPTDSSYGIYVKGSLTVNGSGELTATGGTTMANSYGVLIHNDLTVTGNSRIKGEGGRCDGDSYGMDIDGKLSVSDAGCVEGLGSSDSSINYSYGLAMKSLEVSGIASVWGKGGNANSGSYGLDVGSPLESGNLISVSSGIAEGIAGESTFYDSVGVCVNAQAGSTATVTVSGGSLRGESYAARRSYGMSFTNCSYALTSGSIVARTYNQSGTSQAFTQGPASLPSSYFHRNSSADPFTPSGVTPYVWAASHPFVEIFSDLTPAAAVGKATVSGTANAPLPATEVAVIGLTNARFQALNTGDDVSGWFTNLPDGLSAKVRSVVGTTVRLVLSGTPTVASSDPMSITLPGRVIKLDNIGGIPPSVTVATNANAKWDIAPAPAATVGDVTISGTANTPIAPASVTVTLARAMFTALAADTDATNWFTNLPAGLTAKIQPAVAMGDTTATIAISGTPTAAVSAPMSITVPQAAIDRATAPLAATANANAKWSIAPVTPPQTGDSATPALWLALMLAALATAACVAVAAARKRRRA